MSNPSRVCSHARARWNAGRARGGFVSLCAARAARGNWFALVMVMSLAMSLAACASGDGSSDRESVAAGGPVATVTVLDAPPDAGSSTPNLTVAPDGTVYLSWTARVDSAHAIRLAEWRGGAWGTTQTISSNLPYFVNWADFPSVVALDNGDLVAHWLEREGAGTYAYGVRLARSTNGGVSWSAPLTPHTDGLEAEHGFVSLWDAGAGAVGAVWLDGRKTAMPDSAREMTIRAATFGTGAALSEALLDSRTCDCCQTATARTRRGPVVVYRDRTEDEIRDIAIVRHVDGAWTAPQRVYADEWHFEACPVNGPAVASLGDTVVVAWFTGAQDTARVRVAVSEDGGATFGAPIRIDDGDPVGRVAVVLEDNGGAIVSWLERVAPERGDVRVRRLPLGFLADGSRAALPPAGHITTMHPGRASGFPRMVRSGDQLVFAWTDVRDADAPRVRVATAQLSSGPAVVAAGGAAAAITSATTTPE